MPQKRTSHAARALSAAGALAFAAFVVMRNGGEPPASARPAAAPVPTAAAQPAPAPEPIAEPLVPTPAAPAAPSLSPRDELDIACRRAALLMRPNPFGTDKENLKAARERAELFSALKEYRQRTGREEPREVECPEHLLREYFERVREESQRARELWQAR